MMLLLIQVSQVNSRAEPQRVQSITLTISWLRDVSVYSAALREIKGLVIHELFQSLTSLLVKFTH